MDLFIKLYMDLGDLEKEQKKWNVNEVCGVKNFDSSLTRIVGIKYPKSENELKYSFIGFGNNVLWPHPTFNSYEEFYQDFDYEAFLNKEEDGFEVLFRNKDKEFQLLSMNNWTIKQNVFHSFKIDNNRRKKFGRPSPLYRAKAEISIEDPDGNTTVFSKLNIIPDRWGDFQHKDPIPYVNTLIDILKELSRFKNLQEFYEYHVRPIEGSTTGVGVFINHYLVTAGHIVDGSPQRIEFNGKEYRIDKLTADLLLKPNVTSDNNDVFDIAIYEIPEVSSLLSFGREIDDESLACVSFNHNTVLDGSNVFNYIENYDVVIERCNVIEELYNFYKCKSNFLFREGQSGSPLFHGNLLIGILSGCLEGNETSNTVLFQSVHSCLKKYGKYLIPTSRK